MKNAKTKIKSGTTCRGFALSKFTDKYGYECSLQKSSRMSNGPGDECIWFGVDNPDGNFKILPHSGEAQTKFGYGWQDKCLSGMFPDCDINVPDRMHLTQEMVEALLPALKHFVKTGELPLDK